MDLLAQFAERKENIGKEENYRLCKSFVVFFPSTNSSNNEDSKTTSYSNNCSLVSPMRTMLVFLFTLLLDLMLHENLQRTSTDENCILLLSWSNSCVSMGNFQDV